MNNLSISILNVENIGEFLESVKKYQEKIGKNKNINLFNITVHFDVMDNKFVPNNGIDIEEIKEVVNYGFYVDTHLMVEKPLEKGYIDKTIEYGCRDITIHYEINDFEKNLNYLLQKKKELKNNLKIGVAIKPKTDISVLDKYIEKIDKVLVMSVEPGFGGQSYIEASTKKIYDLKKKYSDKFIQVDGGVNATTALEALTANVDSLVVGSYLTRDTKLLDDKLDILNVILSMNLIPKEADLEFERKSIQVVENGYGKDDILLGIRVPRLRKLSKLWYNIISLNTLDFFISSKIHDYRRFAVYCLVNKVNESNKDEIKAFIDKNIDYINNWDLVDSLAPVCIGKQLLKEDDKYIYNVLREYTKSINVWKKRIGIVSLLYIAKENRKNVVFKVLDDVFYEEYHLIQKANGWVLRELYKVNPKDTLMYLVNKNKSKKIPSILKSYATEKMSSKEKEMFK